MAKKPTSDEATVAAKYQELLQHSRSWQADRECALKLRHWATADSDTIYQCDDKCGSFWQRLPVSETGRDAKDNAKAVYHFAIQANVISGAHGLIRFACVPKNVQTGHNFGLTNLLMVLLKAKRSGRLPNHKKKLIRHTDGGPDNVAVNTHVFHWLLVYLGIFDELVWFRFKAGHSHTEVADRLFAIMKRLFESDDQTRVKGIQDFPTLFVQLREELKCEREELLFEWNFANWDFEKWFEDQNICGTHDGIRSQLVYKYTYDAKLKSHGCVKVQYKKNVAFRGKARDSEYGPIEKISIQQPTANGEGVETVDANVATKNGVIFVRKPPDLTIEPKREDIKGGDFNPSEHMLCTVLLPA